MDQESGDFGGVNDERRVRRGRRAVKKQEVPEEEGSPGAAAPAPAKQGGWGDVSAADDAPAIPAANEGFGGDDDDDDVVDMIPCLEEEEEEDITRQVAEAPKVNQNRIVSLRELDHDKAFNLMPQRGQPIDLSLLMSHL